MNKRQFFRSFVLMLGLFCSLSLFAQKNNMKKVMADHPFLALSDNSKVTLDDIRQKHAGKVIYIDFWASWCGPCRKEMPYSKKMHEALKDEEVVFVYVSIDNKEKPWKRAIERLGIGTEGEHYRLPADDNINFLKFFAIYSIPHYMVIDRKGKFVELDALAPSEEKSLKMLKKYLKKKA